MKQITHPARPGGSHAGLTIAVSSQNRRTVTDHAGKCRRFWVYAVRDAEVLGRRLVELTGDETFHARGMLSPDPLAGIDVLIAGGMGSGLHERLRQRGVMAVATRETDPDRAVSAWLDGSLAEIAPAIHCTHRH
mgnify:CR=1 FL=1